MYILGLSGYAHESSCSLIKDGEIKMRLATDSAAGKGIASRLGLGKLRHLDTHTLWVQQAIRAERIVLCKVDGRVNPADLLTKHSLRAPCL